MRIIGACGICKSEYALPISQAIVDGVPYAEIAKQYPGLGLSKQRLSAHRKHILENYELDQARKLSDHDFIDLLRAIGGAYLLRAQDGKELSMVQARLVTAASNAIVQRYRVTDVSEQSKSMDEMIRRASQSRWKYQEAEHV